MSVLRGTWCGQPRYVVASRVLAVEAAFEQSENISPATAIMMDSIDAKGEHKVIYFAEPVEIVAGALCEALKYSARN